jgi:hypothetical protein
MKARHFLLGLSLLGLFSACSPKVVVKPLQNFPARQLYEGMIVFMPTDPILYTEEEVIGEIRVMDSGITINCDFETVVDSAKAQALRLGANAIKIYKHRPPSYLWSTCHQIRAKALRLKDIKPYEKQIVWDARRKLTVADFKGDTLNRPFQTYSGGRLAYHYNGRRINGYATLKAEAYFDCFRSYFKLGANVQALLEREQIRFDISEIYARRFVQRISTEIKSIEEMEADGEKILLAVSVEMEKRQEQYDNEASFNEEKQRFWLEKTQLELQELQEFAPKQLRIRFKAKKQ